MEENNGNRIELNCESLKEYMSKRGCSLTNEQLSSIYSYLDRISVHIDLLVRIVDMMYEDKPINDGKTECLSKSLVDLFELGSKLSIKDISDNMVK